MQTRHEGKTQSGGGANAPMGIIAPFLFFTRCLSSGDSPR